MPARRWVVLTLVASSIAFVLIARHRANIGRDDRSPSPSVEPAKFVGASACAKCHRTEYELWLGSDHQLAMQEATKETALGNFADARFTYFGVTSSAFEREGKYFVRTDGPDGKLQDYAIDYTFGVRPLQQYLVRFPKGRYQALSIAWDSRPRESGGQRWFHLYPNEPIRHDDELHWTRPSQNWNYMCAECHSTNLQKNYLPNEDRYETTWSEVSVSCEACHGPGSLHVTLAEKAAGGVGWPDEKKGLLVGLNERRGVTWEVDPTTGKATRSRPPGERPESEACARCHARRTSDWPEYEHGRPILDSHRVALLEERLYFPDGQIREEVYEYGSFLQSRMYRKGVTCSDCHEPHSQKLRGSGNSVCAGCHGPQVFDAPSHHFHKEGSPGSQCVECHMPSSNYMVIDARRDHSLRVPRPELSLTLGTPDACTRCHKDRAVKWAAEAVARWYGSGRRSETHYGAALHAGREALPGAEKALVELSRDAEAPGIARATALELLGRYPSPPSLRAVEAALSDADPLVRVGATRALASFPPADRARLAYPLLIDGVRGVRLEAVLALASVPRELLSPDRNQAIDRASEEYRQSQLANADQAWAHLNIGNLESARGKVEEAEKAYRRALVLDRTFIPAYVNLADLMRQSERDLEGERLLHVAVDLAPENADVRHALGLLLTRQKRLPEALTELERAARLAPDNARYSYVLGVGLESAGRIGRALAVLERAQKRHPQDREILIALLQFSEKAGRRHAAIDYARKLVALAPEDAAARDELQRLEQAPAR